MADALHVELVAADRTVWSGDAEMVIARTVEGDLGVLRGHAPVLSLLSEAVVEVRVADTDDVVVAAVDGGFISVALDRVSILSEHIELGEEIDVDKAQAELEEARGAGRRGRRRRGPGPPRRGAAPRCREGPAVVGHG